MTGVLWLKTQIECIIAQTKYSSLKYKSHCFCLLKVLGNMSTKLKKKYAINFSVVRGLDLNLKHSKSLV